MKHLTFKQKVVQGIHDLFYIWIPGIPHDLSRSGCAHLLCACPVGVSTDLCFHLYQETIREVPAVVVDNSRSSLSREYLRKVDSSPEVKIVSYCADMEEAKLMLKDRLAYGIIYIPAEFSEDIARGKQTQVSLYCDMSGLLYYKSLLNTNTSVSLDMNADIKMQRAGNTTNLPG